MSSEKKSDAIRSYYGESASASVAKSVAAGKFRVSGGRARSRAANRYKMNAARFLKSLQQ